MDIYVNRNFDWNQVLAKGNLSWPTVMTLNPWSLSKDIIYSKLISKILQNKTEKYLEKKPNKKEQNSILQWAFDIR